MPSTRFTGTSPIEREEHLEAATAKRVVPFYWNGSSFVSGGLPMVAGIDYDYLDVQQTDSDTETYVFKTGGSGGTTVRTIVVNYTSSTKSDIDTVTWS